MLVWLDWVQDTNAILYSSFTRTVTSARLWYWMHTNWLCSSRMDLRWFRRQSGVRLSNCNVLVRIAIIGFVQASDYTVTEMHGIVDTLYDECDVQADKGIFIGALCLTRDIHFQGRILLSLFCNNFSLTALVPVIFANKFRQDSEKFGENSVFAKLLR